MRWLDSITESNVHESEQTLGDGEGQGSLTCCSPWGRKESDTTEQLHCTALNCGVGEDSWEPLGQQGDKTSQS